MTAAMRARPTVLVVDLVESVRLLQRTDADVIARWERLVGRLRAEWLPQFRGQLVKSLGDGLMLTFDGVQQALSTAAVLLDAMAALNAGHGSEAQMALRVGLHVTDWVKGELDIYGHGVNLCARLAALAQPQSLVLTTASAECLGAALPSDWHWQSLGNCHLKHVEGPLPCLQGRRGDAPALSLGAVPDLRPTLAVLPLEAAEGACLPAGAACVLRDDLVRALARHKPWQVVSRLSTQALGEQADLVAEGVGAHLWLRGRMGGDPQGATLDLSFLEGEQELWSGHYEMSWDKLLRPEGGLAMRVAQAIDQALLRQGLGVGYQPALPTLPSYALLLRALQGMHRLRPDALRQAGEMLEHLAERHPRASDVRAWLAKWHFVRLCQVMSPNAQRTVDEARQAAQEALQQEPGNGVALAVHAQLRVFHDRDTEAGYGALCMATREAPNEAMGWMYLANLQAFRGERQALSSYEQARALSPLDPLGYELDLMGSIANEAVDDFVEALRLAQRSVQRNPTHLSSLVQQMVCLIHTGQNDAARLQARAYLDRRPQASVRRFIDLHPAGDTHFARRQAEALLAAGLPL
jgi:class 3 adenylate cyclase/tetratricopeptide (TPR) repeat protein